MDALDAQSNNSGTDSHPSRNNSHSDLVALGGVVGGGGGGGIRLPAGSAGSGAALGSVALQPGQTRPNPRSMYSGEDATGGANGASGRGGRGSARPKRSSDGSVGSTGARDNQATGGSSPAGPVAVDGGGDMRGGGEMRDIRRPNKLYTDDR